MPGFNDLATTRPDLAQQAYGWDPKTVTAGSSRKLPWKCSMGHTWHSSVSNRTKGRGCPVCANKRVLPGCNDLATIYPQIASEAIGWDPSLLTPGSHKKLNWRCEKGHEWQAAVRDRTPPRSSGCPICCGKKVSAGVNDLAHLYPDIAKEAVGWDPSSVTVGCGKKMLWRCALGHQWVAAVQSRTPPRGSGCPVCCGQKIMPGINDLGSVFPDIASQADGWDPSLVSPKTNHKLPWICSLGHRWEAVVSSRTPPSSSGCPYCSGRKVIRGLNDLFTLYPVLAAEAHGWDPSDVLPKTNKKYKWKCKFGHVWNATPNSRTPPASCGCPVCSNKKLLSGFNDVANRFPDIAQEAYGWDPTQVISASSSKLSWRCKKGHTWVARVRERCYGRTGCPSCAKYGFKPHQNAWIYLMERPGEQQIGITNEPDVRLARHASNGWSEIEILGPCNGSDALNIETQIRQWLKIHGVLVPNTNENWFTAKLEVRSIEDLLSKVGNKHVLLQKQYKD